jgi:hypothetical protein
MDGGLSDKAPLTDAESRHGAGGEQGAPVRAQGRSSSSHATTSEGEAWMPNGRTAWTLAVSLPEALASRDEGTARSRKDRAAAVRGASGGTAPKAVVTRRPSP